MSAETLHEFDAPLLGSDGLAYRARACGRDRNDGTWEGWIEFEAAGADVVWRTPRETTQPNHKSLLYWASGVSAVYLEGALSRAMEPEPMVVLEALAPPAFDGPRGETPPLADAGDPVLDPLELYASKGETMLRRQLGALAAWHLRTIVRSYRIPSPDDPETMSKLELIETIVEGAKAARTASAAAR